MNIIISKNAGSAKIQNDGSWYAEQNVHSLRLLVPHGEESADDQLEQILLSLPKRRKTFLHDFLQSSQRENDVHSHDRKL